MAEPNDPRVFFAAERTLLAWLRSGLTVIGLGFVVARFGLFLAIINPAHQGKPAHHLSSTAIGVVLVLMGTAAAVGAAVQFRRFCRTLAPSDRPPGYWTGAGALFAFALAGAGAALAVYLVAWAGTD
jgi:putative membrane protein